MSLAGTFYRGYEAIPLFQHSLENLPWQPDLIFIFSGYDGHKDDQGKNVASWDNNDFVNLTQIVLNTAKKASCPIISTHGGGYNFDVTVAAALAHVHALFEE